MSKKPSTVTWTDEMVGLLRTLHAQGIAYPEIGRRITAMLKVAGVTMKITGSSVSSKVKREGLSQSASATGIKSTSARLATKKAKSQLTVERQKRAAPEDRIVQSGGAPESKNNVTFMERRAGQCSRFVGDQDGPDGFVCGVATTGITDPWCPQCRPFMFDRTGTRKSDSKVSPADQAEVGRQRRKRAA